MANTKSKQVMQQAIQKANNQNNVQVRVGHANINHIKANYDDTTPLKKRFKEQVLNLNQVLKEKFQYLLAGKPVIVDCDMADGEGEFKLNEFVYNLELQETFFQLLGIMFEKYNAFVVIDKIGKQVSLRIADPNFPNVVFRMGKVPYRAEIWTAFKFERAQYWKQTIYTNDKIVNKLFTDPNGNFDEKKSIELKSVNERLPKHLRIIEQMDGLGFIPVEQFQLKPSFDYSTGYTNNTPFSDRLEPFQNMLDEATFNSRREGYLNRSKMFIDNDLLDDEGNVEQIADEGIIGIVSDSGDHKGDNKLFEVIQGDPKFAEYWENITNIISLAIRSLKLSEIDENSSSSSATEAIFNKGNDVETGNTFAMFYQRSLKRLLAKAYHYWKNEKVNETEIDLTQWGVQVLPNVIMNEAKMTEIVIQQLGAGLIDMVTAKSKLEGINTIDAKESLDNVANEAYENPTLQSATAFNDMSEMDDDISNNNGGDVVDNK